MSVLAQRDTHETGGDPPRCSGVARPFSSAQARGSRRARVLPTAPDATADENASAPAAVGMRRALAPGGAARRTHGAGAGEIATQRRTTRLYDLMTDHVPLPRASAGGPNAMFG